MQYQFNIQKSTLFIKLTKQKPNHTIIEILKLFLIKKGKDFQQTRNRSHFPQSDIGH